MADFERMNCHAELVGEILMKITYENVSHALKEYEVVESIKEITYLIENYKVENSKAKVIIKVELSDDKAYIIKFILDNETTHNLIEEQSIFSECMRLNGINTPKRLKNKGKHCTIIPVEGLRYDVTVEEYLGEELTFINSNIVQEIANLMAKMHTISQENNCHIRGNTIWNIFCDKSDISRGFKSFCEYRHNSDYDWSLYNTDLYQSIIDLYEQRLSRLKSIWHKLPCYATQGDYSINNLAFKDGRVKGIFDYNIAGDEALVSDMIIEGLFVSYEMDLDNCLIDDDKDRLFKLFVKTYMQCRKLTQIEIKVMNDIYAVVFPFWWTRIIFDSKKSLRKYLEENNTKKVNEFLDETHRLLQLNYFDSNL